MDEILHNTEIVDVTANEPLIALGRVLVTPGALDLECNFTPTWPCTNAAYGVRLTRKIGRRTTCRSKKETGYYPPTCGRAAASGLLRNGIGL